MGTAFTPSLSVIHSTIFVLVPCLPHAHVAVHGGCSCSPPCFGTAAQHAAHAMAPGRQLYHNPIRPGVMKTRHCLHLALLYSSSSVLSLYSQHPNCKSSLCKRLKLAHPYGMAWCVTRIALLLVYIHWMAGVVPYLQRNLRNLVGEPAHAAAMHPAPGQPALCRSSTAAAQPCSPAHPHMSASRYDGQGPVVEADWCLLHQELPLGAPVLVDTLRGTTAGLLPTSFCTRAAPGGHQLSV
jgi:hypothetical protein